jgi:hypothetical protein
MATNNGLNHSSAPFTVTSGDLSVSSGNINMPTPTSSIGVYNINGFRFMYEYGASTFLGRASGKFTASGTDNIGIGVNSAQALSTGAYNTLIGNSAGIAINSGSQNCALGSYSFVTATSAENNIAIGSGIDPAIDVGGPLAQLTTGRSNIAIGSCISSNPSTGAGYNYINGESSNIILGGMTLGTATESNVMRLGTSGSSEGEINTTYIAGVYGVNAGSIANVATVATTGKFGTAAITAGVGISVTPSANTITVAATGSNSSLPAFLAILESNDNNVTGDGALYTMGTNVALTKIYDQTSSFNTNGTFTAPVTGKYFLHTQLIIGSCTTAFTFSTYIVTSSRTYQTQFERTASSHNGFGNNSIVALMTAGDTAIVQVSSGGESGNTNGLDGSGSCLFTGYLVC